MLETTYSIIMWRNKMLWFFLTYSEIIKADFKFNFIMCMDIGACMCFLRTGQDVPQHLVHMDAWDMACQIVFPH